MQLISIYNFLNSLAPFNLACNWDNSGFLIGDINAYFQNCLICLDVTDKIIDECIEKKCNLIISHHPIIFNKLKKITSDMLVYKLVKNDINVVSLHTNLDIASQGVNFVLANKLNLSNLSPLQYDINGFSYKISIFVPQKYECEIKNIMTSLGTKVYETNIDNFNYQTLGQPINSHQANNDLKIDAIMKIEDINKCLSQINKLCKSVKFDHEIKEIYNKSDFTSFGLIGTSNISFTPYDFNCLAEISPVKAPLSSM